MSNHKDITGYDLSRNWFDWCFENPEKISPTHTAMYFFIIEHCNRLGWKEKFGLPMEMTKDAIGISNFRTYTKTFTDLVEWGFIKIYEKSKNQYSSNIIGIVKNTKAHTKALDKALQKHSHKQVQKQSNSIVYIDKPINNITINKETYREFAHLKMSISEFETLNKRYPKERIDKILDAIENYRKNINYTSLTLTASKWLEKEDRDSLGESKLDLSVSINQKIKNELKAKFE